MTTDVDIDPRMVCRACGWEVERVGSPGHDDWFDIVTGPAQYRSLESLCDGAAYMGAVMEALTVASIQVNVMWSIGSGWRALYAAADPVSESTRPYDFVAFAPTPHEAVYALATKIGRAMEVE
jgi:allantoicase